MTTLEIFGDGSPGNKAVKNNVGGGWVFRLEGQSVLHLFNTESSNLNGMGCKLASEFLAATSAAKMAKSFLMQNKFSTQPVTDIIHYTDNSAVFRALSSHFWPANIDPHANNRHTQDSIQYAEAIDRLPALKPTRRISIRQVGRSDPTTFMPVADKLARLGRHFIFYTGHQLPIDEVKPFLESSNREHYFGHHHS